MTQYDIKLSTLPNGNVKASVGTPPLSIVVDHLTHKVVSSDVDTSSALFRKMLAQALTVIANKTSTIR